MNDIIQWIINMYGHFINIKSPISLKVESLYLKQHMCEAESLFSTCFLLELVARRIYCNCSVVIGYTAHSQYWIVYGLCSSKPPLLL